MANGRLYSFIVGVAAGVAASVFIKSEKGQALVKDIKTKVSEGLDNIEQTFMEKMQSFQEAAVENAEKQAEAADMAEDAEVAEN